MTKPEQPSNMGFIVHGFSGFPTLTLNPRFRILNFPLSWSLSIRTLSVTYDNWAYNRILFSSGNVWLNWTSAQFFVVVFISRLVSVSMRLGLPLVLLGPDDHFRPMILEGGPMIRALVKPASQCACARLLPMPGLLEQANRPFSWGCYQNLMKNGLLTVLDYRNF